MIFVPKKKDCLIWNEMEDGIYILYYIDGNENKEFGIKFRWANSFKSNLKLNEKEYDPFYLSVIECMNDVVLKCPLNCCSAYPQLRYNKIINKWFCNCPSSAISTKNTDESELTELLSLTKKYNEKNGFCNGPIEAILKWNENCAKDYENIAKENLKKYKNWENKDK